ncbi:amidase [Glaciecola sp. MH2013]|uniref:amidase n=1 Tax=Glaciecola sp. MH2013 TaxID=2785524 RepID=UPI00189DBC2E|nr:amidase [Glaciecola sp. MH2013]MBF7074525.1 amidase [Glaciecola sp. MH2013]
MSLNRRLLSVVIASALSVSACANVHSSADKSETAQVTSARVANTEYQANKNSKYAAPDILDLSASQQAAMIAKGELSSEELISTYLQRIALLDSNGPRVQSVLSLNPNALAEAKMRDLQVKNGEILGRLHGIPVLVKDNVETSELPTTAGAIALKDNMTGRDAPIIAKLKAEGAIILGKTNLSQWANFRSNDSVSGWSAIGGQTRNPHSLDRTPCGSSSGSGAAIAAQLASLAIGTETNGSIICPTAMNGIAGVKPTVGLLSRSRIVPISVTQDTAGPMTRSIEDAALMLSVMAGSDAADPYTEEADNKKEDYVGALKQSLKGKRLGVMKSVQSEHPAIIKAFESSLSELESQGVELVVIDEFSTPEGFWGKALDLLLIEFKHELNLYLADAAPQVKHRDLASLIAFNNENEREFAIFDQSLFLQAQEKDGYNEEYQEIRRFLAEATRTNGIDKLLADYEVDALVMPSQTPAFLIDPVYGDSFAGGFAGAGWLAAIAGYPQVSVPMGEMKGLPINLSFIGAKWDEATLLNFAYQYEQKTKAIIKPTFANGAFDHKRFKEAMRPMKQ